jgi:UDP-2,4-diacetamido-2,4,6-trideoxy-beta-L-altropyranose hydrolase
MRCLALADGLTTRGLQCLFICRSIDQVLRNELLRRGHELRLLPPSSEHAVSYDDALPYSKWLGVSPADDAEATRDIVRTAGIDWLITDHYGIDRRWHERMRGVVRSIMAIDDLADRGHDCDILLNPSDLTGVAARYRSLTGDSCRLLLGPRYALLARSSLCSAIMRSPRLRTRLYFLSASAEATRKTIRPRLSALWTA